MPAFHDEIERSFLDPELKAAYIEILEHRFTH